MTKEHRLPYYLLSDEGRTKGFLISIRVLPEFQLGSSIRTNLPRIFLIINFMYVYVSVYRCHPHWYLSIYLIYADAYQSISAKFISIYLFVYLL